MRFCSRTRSQGETVVGGAFECGGMDFKEMDKSKLGNRYALVLQDYLTNWPEIYAVPDQRAETVARSEPIMLFKLLIMLLSNAQKFSLLCLHCTQLCSIMLQKL